MIGIILALTVAACAAASFAFSGAMTYVSLTSEQAARVEAIKDALKRLGTVQSSELNETSGIDFSKRHPTKLWFHNDSGNSATIYLVDPSGHLDAKCPIEGTKNFDWEDNCCFEHQGKPYILIGDVGDNGERRKTYELLLIADPKIQLSENKTVTHPIKEVSKIVFTYEDGPRNCEALAFDSETNSVLLIQKVFGRTRTKGPPGIYQIDLSPWLEGSDSKSSRQAVAVRIADFNGKNVTGMDISDDNSTMIIRNYLTAHRFKKAEGQSWAERLKEGNPECLTMPLERQGEAICLTSNGESIIVTSEFSRQPIWEIEAEKAIQR